MLCHHFWWSFSTSAQQRIHLEETAVEVKRGCGSPSGKATETQGGVQSIFVVLFSKRSSLPGDKDANVYAHTQNCFLTSRAMAVKARRENYLCWSQHPALLCGMALIIRDVISQSQTADREGGCRMSLQETEDGWPKEVPLSYRCRHTRLSVSLPASPSIWPDGHHGGSFVWTQTLKTLAKKSWLLGETWIGPLEVGSWGH